MLPIRIGCALKISDYNKDKLPYRLYGEKGKHMNKVINGSRYDTSTARHMGYATSGNNYGDLSFWYETLYRTKSGKYFLHGDGGPMSKYAKSTGDGWGWGEKIIPLSEENARKWAEEHLSGDDVDRIFGTVAESTTRICVFLPADLVEKMDAKGDALHANRAEMIAAALRQYLKD